MSYSTGDNIKIEISGSSHGDHVAVEIAGIPAGIAVDTAELQRFLDRRAPGRSGLVSSRKEADVPEFESGLSGGKTDGNILRAVIRNTSQRPSDYDEIADTPRPSHADLTAWIRYGGKMDMRGGGPFSGRMTAPLCVAGGIAVQILRRMGVAVGAHLAAVGNVTDDPFPLYPDESLFREIAEKELPMISDCAAQKMKEEILKASGEGDSLGGIVECAVTGVPAGAGGPLFRGLEGEISRTVFAISGVRGVEFGDGFRLSGMRGSQGNDPIIIEGGSIRTETNRSGGIQGGITNGMPVVFRAAFRPTPSISVPQRTVSLSRMEETVISVNGRHDPCIAVRAVPVVEAAAAVTILDIIVGEWEWNLLR